VDSWRRVQRWRAIPEPGQLWFLPVIDGDVIPSPNEDLYRTGRFNDTPILVGTNSDEGHGNAPPGLTAAVLRDHAHSATCPQEAEAVLSLYPLSGDANATRTFETLYRDGGSAWNTWTWARWQSRKGRGKVYVYYFDFPIAKFPNGVPHWAEVPYVFGYYGWWNEQRMPLRSEDLATSDLIRRYWINFAANGDPNGKGLPPWPAFSEDSPNAMVFDQPPSARPLPNLERRRAFDAWYTCVWRQKG
jgi:para-nitrobenzyl esterase